MLLRTIPLQGDFNVEVEGRGYVYDGNSEAAARNHYAVYVSRSKAEGADGGKAVTLRTKKGDVLDVYKPAAL